MTIKKRLFLSHLLMLLISFIVVCILYIGTFRILDMVYWNSSADYSALNENTADVQELLDDYILSGAPETLDEFYEDFPILTYALNEFGFNAALVHNNTVLLSSLDSSQSDYIGSFPQTIQGLSTSIIYHLGDASIVQTPFIIDGSEYILLAVSQLPDEALRQNIYTTFSVSILVLSLLVILITGMLISARVAKTLVKPLEKLRTGAEWIKLGNLEYDIDYQATDEVGQVCASFNEMRSRLKDSIQTSLRYEQDRKELVAGISHDLRTPLTSIKGYVKGLQDGVASTPEKQAHYLDIIYRKACEMDGLVDKLFMFSKLDTGNFPFYLETVQCDDYLKGYIEIVSDDFLRKGLHIHYENHTDEYIPYAHIDCDQMSRVLTNILENSAKYKPQDEIDVCISLHSSRGNLIIQLQDNGLGVPEDELSRLFTSFYRGDPSRNNPAGGSGLGLSIAERIITAHHGKIYAKNNGGLMIIIELPRICTEEES